MFGGRKDLMNTVVYGEDGKPLCICSKPGGKYLFYFVTNPEERGDSTPAEHIAQ